MPIPRLSLIPTAMALVCSVAHAQEPRVQVQAGLGYARVFEGGGASFAVAVDHPFPASTGPVRHALGVSLWYANPAIASRPEDPDGRELVGIGARYEIALRTCCRRVYPFLVVPIRLLRSSIPDRPALAAAGALFRVVPESPSTAPEDRAGSAWGWSTGLEAGLHVPLDEQLGLRTSVQGLYQDVYAASTTHGGWIWHAGVSYRFGGP